MDGAVITAVDRKRGTITVSSFDAVLKELYRADAVQSVIREELPFFGRVRSADVTRLAGCKVGPVADGYEFRMEAYAQLQCDAPGFTGRMTLGEPEHALSPAGLMALTTLAGLEWLRRRKDAVAEAEQTGDYSSLVAEFCEWLRGILRAWREALTLRGRSDAGAQTHLSRVMTSRPVAGSKPADPTKATAGPVAAIPRRNRRPTRSREGGYRLA